MKKLPLILFVLLVGASLVTGIYSYRRAARGIASDVDRALALTLCELPTDVVTVDTIRCYRSHIECEEVREHAFIAVRTRQQETELVAQTGCDAGMILRMSDQRASVGLLVAALLWLVGSTLWMRRRYPQLAAEGIAYGGLLYSPQRQQFFSAQGERIHLTPMQHQLMEMFWQAPDHSLSKDCITQALWPKKPDANDTLYTLIRRLKPIVEAHSELKIESDRGKSYSLEIK